MLLLETPSTPWLPTGIPTNRCQGGTVKSPCRRPDEAGEQDPRALPPAVDLGCRCDRPRRLRDRLRQQRPQGASHCGADECGFHRRRSRLAKLDTRVLAIMLAHNMIRGLSPLRLCASGRILEPVTNGLPRCPSQRCQLLLVLPCVTKELVADTVRHGRRGSRRFAVIDGK